MYNFCIITGDTYISKALVMYKSLLNTKLNFNLYYYCFDEATFNILNQLIKVNDIYNKIIPIYIDDVEKERLDRVKGTRTQQEFFFTLTPFIIDHSIKKFGLDMCTYIDADIYFFQDPKVIFNEMKDKSVLITRHNYSIENEYLLYAGEYCVQFNPFRNNDEGMKVLTWWKDKCEEWCYLKQEDGKWGDQGYLNQWPELFKSVIVSENPGGGMAPWNIRKFFLLDKSNFKFKDLESGKKFDLVFYHFQSVKLYFSFIFFIGNGNFTKGEKNALYKPYFEELKKVTKEIKNIDKGLNPLGNMGSIKELWFLFKKLVRRKLIFYF